MRQPDFGHTVFIDRSFGAYRLSNLLRKVGINIEVHKDHFKQDEEDAVWIPDVTARGWVIFSSDRRISKDPVNVAAVLASKARVITTTDNNLLPEFWAAAFMVGRKKLCELLDRNSGPAYFQVGHSTGDHIKVIKQRIAGQQAIIETVSSVSEEKDSGQISSEEKTTTNTTP